MKTVLIGILANLLFLSSFSQNHQFSITWSYGMDGGSTPTTSHIDKEDALSNVEANKLVRFFLDSANLDFKCIYNGCQNRAMVMSLILNKRGIKHYKIWNFDPFKISIFNAQDALDVDDILGLKSSRVVWDFHVAVAVLVNSVSGMDTLVIDPSFSDKPLNVSEWLAMQHSPNSYFTFLDPIWYNYVTLSPNSSFTCNDKTKLTIPTCFPYLLTGDFYRYGASNHRIIAQELATNEQISKIAENIIAKLPDTDESKARLISLVTGDFSSLQNILQGNNTLESGHPFKKYLNDYQARYAKSVEYWTKQLKNM